MVDEYKPELVNMIASKPVQIPLWSMNTKAVKALLDLNKCSDSSMVDEY